MVLSELIQLAAEKSVLAFLILLAQLLEQIHKTLAPKLREEIGPQVAHAPPTLHILPWRLFIRSGFFQRLDSRKYTCMPVVEHAHIWAIFHYRFF